MGLDIRAYGNISVVSEENLVDYFDFCSDLPMRKVQDIFEEGENFIDYDEFYSIRAGSYGGYNAWRNELAVMVGNNSSNETWDTWERDAPFHELICFSDCEGYIGESDSKKLYDDFAEYEHMAAQKSEYFYSKYKEWMECFRVASNNGIVVFS